MDQFVVSWIQVWCLVFAILGLLYGSLGVFGKWDAKIFGPCLPATLAVLLTSLYEMLSSNFVPKVWSPVLDTPLPWSKYIGVFLIAYFVAWGFQRWSHPWHFKEVMTRAQVIHDPGCVLNLLSFGCFIIIVFMLIFIAIAYFIASRDFLGTLISVGILGLSFMVYFVMVWFANLVYILSNRRLQQIGFFAALLGIIAGYLPALLDVMGITIIATH